MRSFFAESALALKAGLLALEYHRLPTEFLDPDHEVWGFVETFNVNYAIMIQTQQWLRHQAEGESVEEKMERIRKVKQECQTQP